jgi:hypothetical protein
MDKKKRKSFVEGLIGLVVMITIAFFGGAIFWGLLWLALQVYSLELPI